MCHAVSPHWCTTVAESEVWSRRGAVLYSPHTPSRELTVAKAIGESRGPALTVPIDDRFAVEWGVTCSASRQCGHRRHRLPTDLDQLRSLADEYTCKGPLLRSLLCGWLLQLGIEPTQ